MLLAEELMLLLLDDDKGTMPVSASTQIDTLLGGSLLVELAALERVGVRSKKVGGKLDRLALLSTARTGDALLDSTLERLRESDGRPVTEAVGKAAKGAREAVIDRLVTMGALSDERRRLLGILPSRTLPAADPRWEQQVRGRVLAVLDDGKAPDLHTGSIIAVLLAGNLLSVAFPVDVEDRTTRKTLTAQRQERAKQAASASWASDATKQALENARNALIAVTASVAIVPVITSSS